MRRPPYEAAAVQPLSMRRRSSSLEIPAMRSADAIARSRKIFTCGASIYAIALNCKESTLVQVGYKG